MEQLNVYDITFPIFKLPDFRRIWEDTNVLYIETESGVYILDNKNLDGDTLGKRRIRISSEYKCRLQKAYYTISQMIKSNKKHFIDSTGRPFNYKKTTRVPLKYYKVTEVSTAKDGECILHVPKINFMYKINCRMAYTIEYIGILLTPLGNLIYEFSDCKKPDTYRKI